MINTYRDSVKGPFGNHYDVLFKGFECEIIKVADKLAILDKDIKYSVRYDFDFLDSKTNSIWIEEFENQDLEKLKAFVILSWDLLVVDIIYAEKNHFNLISSYFKNKIEEIIEEENQ